MGDLVLPAESESESVAEGKTRQLRDGRWSVQCKWCEEKKTEQAEDDSAFYENAEDMQLAVVESSQEVH